MIFHLIILITVISKAICGIIRIIRWSVIIVGSFPLFFCCTHQHEEVNLDFLNNVDFMEGDIVFRRGKSFSSRVVLSADNGGAYSHVGIIFKRGDSAFYVAHEVPGESASGIDKLEVESIPSFFSPEKAEAGAFMRVNCSFEDREKVIAGIVWAINAALPFDHDYNLEDTTKMYCTELIWYAYKKAGIDLVQGKRTVVSIPALSGEYILPSDIYNSSLLSCLYSYSNRCD